MKTYISLFSSAGVGCYGFKQVGFECVATNELVERRLEIQKFNNKCKFDTGYICGDITQKETQQRLYDEVTKWNRNPDFKGIDVLIATPPCQGMSVANHKKNDHEIVRNSLVVESIKIINNIKPNYFIFENVPAFMKTICTDIDGKDKSISEAIKNNLGSNYMYFSKVINFKNYGACSSRFRTIVIGVKKSLADFVSPFELFPDFKKERTLRETIGNLPSLKVMGEISNDDVYHFFRSYPEHMREWIRDLKEGESAFDNIDDRKKPHQIVDGKIVINKQKNADKYTRQYWDKVGPCVHTRNDQLASQNTIHPSDDRVFSIRELMLMMSVPKDFKWSKYSLDELNEFSDEQKRNYLKKEEIKIRQSLGEAVPTAIFKSIAEKIVKFGMFDFKKEEKIRKTLSFSEPNTLIGFLNENPLSLSPYSLMTIAEQLNTNRTDNAAYYTNKSLITEMLLNLDLPEKESLKVLEPSVGIGNFVFLLLKKYEQLPITLDVIDVDKTSLEIFKIFLEKFSIPNHIKINIINDDFLTHKFEQKYDLIIGNPPFYKLNSSSENGKIYHNQAINKESNNIASYFLDKATTLGSKICFVFPKFLLNTPEFAKTRERLNHNHIDAIIDFGENGFKGVLIETIAIIISMGNRPNYTYIKSTFLDFEQIQKQTYYTDAKLPYWIIYRNSFFDKVFEKMEFDVFDVVRDRQITNSVTNNQGGIRVVKSRNITDDGNVISIPGYDTYISADNAKKLAIYKFYKSRNVYLTPNMTYYPRVIKKDDDFLVNGSVAILIPKKIVDITKEQLSYFSSDEYRKFYKIARNFQTRSLNVDSCSVFFFGLLRG